MRFIKRCFGVSQHTQSVIKTSLTTDCQGLLRSRQESGPHAELRIRKQGLEAKKTNLVSLSNKSIIRGLNIRLGHKVHKSKRIHQNPTKIPNPGAIFINFYLHFIFYVFKPTTQQCVFIYLLIHLYTKCTLYICLKSYVVSIFLGKLNVL